MNRFIYIIIVIMITIITSGCLTLGAPQKLFFKNDKNDTLEVISYPNDLEFNLLIKDVTCDSIIIKDNPYNIETTLVRKDNKYYGRFRFRDPRFTKAKQISFFLIFNKCNNNRDYFHSVKN